MQLITDRQLLKNTHIGHYGEPKASAFLAKAIAFYARLLLLPFTVKWSESQRTYKLIKFNLLQKGLWTILVFGNSISFFFWVSTSIGELDELSKNGESMTGALILVCLLLTWLSVATVFYTVWTKQEKVVQLLEAIEGRDVLHFSSIYVWVCPALFYITSSITNLSSATGQVTLSHGSKMVTDSILCALRSLGIVDKCSGRICQGLECGLQGFLKLIVFHGGCFCSMPHTLLLSVCLGLRQIGNELRRTLEKDIYLSVYEGWRLYDNAKLVSNCVHDVFGGIILTHYLCNLTYAIQTPFLFSEVGQTVEDVNYLLWLFVSGLIWWTGSEFHRLVHDSFKKWIHSNLNRSLTTEDLLKLSILSNTIEKDAVGFYCRYFTVTHRFLTTTCGAVLTYGIIVLQVQLKPVEICRSQGIK